MSLSSLVMSCLVQIVSVRRSLFNAVERGKFLNDIVKGIKGILENPQVSLKNKVEIKGCGVEESQLG